MAYYYEDYRYRLIVGQVFIIIYAILATLIGINIWTFILILALSLLSSQITGRIIKGPLERASRSVDEILSARRLYEEKDVSELQTQDTQQLSEIQDQLRFFTYLNISLLLGLAYFFVFWGYIPSLSEFFADKTGNIYLGRFAAFLVYLEGFFVVNQLSMHLALSRAGTLTFLTVPRNYIVTEKGIVYSALLSRKGIGFPLPDGIAIDVSEQRRFVELIVKGRKTTSKLRLYSRNPRRLYEIILRNGFQQASQ